MRKSKHLTDWLFHLKEEDNLYTNLYKEILNKKRLFKNKQKVMTYRLDGSEFQEITIKYATCDLRKLKDSILTNRIDENGIKNFRPQIYYYAEDSFFNAHRYFFTAHKGKLIAHYKGG